MAPQASISVWTRSKDMLGAAGSFKTCHRAALYPIRLSQSQQPLSYDLSLVTWVAKRCFHRPERRSDDEELPKRQRYPHVQELGLMLREANCLYWGGALMNLVYSFVDSVLEEANEKKEPADFDEVPRLKFVRSILAVPEDKANQVFLLEEKIDGPFVKYISNASATACEPFGYTKKSKARRTENWIRAQFLCFAQHVQYVFTGKSIILTDLQGAFNIIYCCALFDTLLILLH